MISPEEAHYGVNLGFHIWILFTFLTILFFTFISRKEKDSVTKELNSAIDDNVPDVLDSIDKMSGEFGIPVNWSKVNTMAENIKKKYNGPDPDIEKHNKGLIKTAVLICAGLLLVLICAVLYFTYYKKFDIHIKTILIENFFIAVFVGLIELLFFLNIALKYSPVTTSDMINQLVDRSEYHINQELN